MNQKTWSIIGMALLFITVGGLTFAPPFLRRISEPKGPELDLPQSNILENDISDEIKSYLIRNGKTLIELEYDKTCLECQDTRFFLESAANQFSDQIILIELESSNEAPTITMSSYFTQKNMINATNEELMDALCEALVEPPVVCATRNI